MKATAPRKPSEPGKAAAPHDALPLNETHRPRGARRTSKRGRLRAVVLIGVHLLAALHIWHWVSTGSSISPLEPSESGETLVTGAVNAGFIFFALLILSTLVLGRFFCGWACHLVALQDLCAWMLGKVGLRPRPLRSRLLVFIPLLAALEMFVLPSVFGPDSRWDGISVELETEAYWARFPGLGMALLTFLVDGFLIVWWLGAKAFCTYGCPYGAIFGLADKVAPGRIRVTDDCESCGHCTAVCTSNVRVHAEVAAYGMVVDSGCMKCLDCVSVCPKDALYFGFGESRTSALARGKGKQPQKRYDLSWPEEIAGAVLFAGSLYATRNLYERVPFLLAIGLSVLVAIAAISGARLLRQRNFRYQNTDLRKEGRWTAAGVAAGVAIAVTLGLVGHSALVQYNDRAGTRLFNGASHLPVGSPARAEQAAASLVHLRRASELALVDTPSLQHRLSQALRSQGENEAARVHAERALELDDTMLTPRLLLADLAMIAADPEGAAVPLIEILERAPDHHLAAERLAQLAGAADGVRDTYAARLAEIDNATLHIGLSQGFGARGQFEASRFHARRALALDETRLAPRLLLADVALAEGDPEQAIAPLRAIVEREPANPAAIARLKQVIGADVDLLDAHVLLARALFAAGDTKNAKSGLEWVLKRAPNHPSAIQLRSELD